VFNRNNEKIEDIHEITWEIKLSEYIDGRMTAEQATAFEAELEASQEKKRKLEDTRATISAVKGLAANTPRAPRSFTLSETQVRKMRPRPLYKVAYWATTVAALLLVGLLVLDVFGSFNVTTTRVVQADVPTSLPTFGTVPNVTCTTPGDNGSVCAASDPGGTVIYPPQPPKTVITETSKDALVLIIEAVLVGFVVASAAFAFALRPRAPARI
jgi:hypothetical protein